MATRAGGSVVPGAGGAVVPESFSEVGAVVMRFKNVNMQQVHRIPERVCLRKFNKVVRK